MRTEECVVCGGPAYPVREERPYSISRQSVMIQDEFYRCEACEEQYYTPAQSEAAQIQAVDQLREQRKLMPAGEIRALRERLGLTQAEFEALLGVGTNTVVRWENGYLFPNAATSALLFLLEANPENARLLARWHHVELGTAA